MQEIRQLLEQGMSARQIAAQTGCSRREVQELAGRIKQEKQSRIKKVLAIIAVAVVASAGIFWLITSRREAVVKSNDPMSWHPAITRSLGELQATYTSDVWLLQDDRVTDEAIQNEIRVSHNYIERMNSALASYESIPEVKTLKEEFGGKFRPTVFSPTAGTSRTLFSGIANPKDIEPQPGSLEVCFSPRNAENHPRIRGQLLLYDPNWRALFIGALDYPDKRWFDALAIHELWHAHLHRLGAISSTAPMRSDPWISEELAAHALEDVILNVSTQGKYVSTVHDIASKIKAVSVGDFMRQIPADDLKRLDEVFIKGSHREGRVRVATYVLTLVRDWLSQRYSGDELQQQQIQAYRMIIQYL